MSEDQAYRVMMTAHKRGVCVVAVFTKDVAETKATGVLNSAAAPAIRSHSRPSRRSSQGRAATASDLA
jgi:ATP-dependent Clp protease adapter protein ClpS